MKPGERIRAFVDANYRRLTSVDGDHTPWTPIAADGQQKLTEFLESSFGSRVTALEALDTAVFRVDWHDRASSVARVFPRHRPIAEVLHDQDVLNALEEWQAVEDPVDQGVGRIGEETVWLTRFSDGEPRALTEDDAAVVGDLVGRLHTLPHTPPFDRISGAWHAVSPGGGTRRDDLVVLAELLEDARSLGGHADRAGFDAIIGEIGAIDHCEDLPYGFSHVDPYQPNLLWRGAEPTLVDWAGAGRAPRITMLPFLPHARDPGWVDAFSRAYRRYIELEPVELERLADAFRSHSLVIDAWTAVFVRDRANDIAKRVQANRRAAEIVAARVRVNFAAR